jgi:hypothetical protein
MVSIFAPPIRLAISLNTRRPSGVRNTSMRMVDRSSRGSAATACPASARNGPTKGSSGARIQLVSGCAA